MGESYAQSSAATFAYLEDRGRRIGEGEGGKTFAVSVDVFVGVVHNVVPKWYREDVVQKAQWCELDED